MTTSAGFCNPGQLPDRGSIPIMPWQLEHIAEALVSGLALAERDCAAEQAVHGLDALDEIALHPLLARGLREAGFAVFPETPYPGQPKVLPKESERLRCDLVVAEGGTTAIADSVQQGKEVRRAEGTLFAEIAPAMVTPPAGAVPPDEALWIEVKTIGQFTYTDGYAGPNRGYASQFNACMADIRKLAKGESIGRAVLAMVLFHATPEIAEHDLLAFMHKCLDRQLPVSDLRTASLPIADRIGNAACTVGLVRVKRGDSR